MLAVTQTIYVFRRPVPTSNDPFWGYMRLAQVKIPYCLHLYYAFMVRFCPETRTARPIRGNNGIELNCKIFLGFSNVQVYLFCHE